MNKPLDYQVVRMGETSQSVHFVRPDGKSFVCAEILGSAVVLLKDELNALLRETRELRKKMKNQRRALRYHERFRQAFGRGVSVMELQRKEDENAVLRTQLALADPPFTRDDDEDVVRSRELEALREQVARLMRENAELQAEKIGHQIEP